MVNLSKSIFLMQLDIMKSVLKLMEFRFGGREGEPYKYVKEQIMNFFYEGLKKFFQNGIKNGTFERCSCQSNLRQGFKKCEFCGGSGFCDKVNNN